MTALIVTALYLCAVPHIIKVWRIKNWPVTIFYLICFAGSYVVLLLHVLGKVLYGPAQLIWDIVRALSLI